ncbi:N-glycosyltransferase [Pseudomonas putida]|uniref:Glycosyl transferase family 2 n=1 Tax=Pseudomonas guariconensis TaxID=1288410 RepID=A0AAX0W013_9PSED|nr:glycosyltransferase [Pseudomonas guariconensis]CAB5525279.1 N-glycosyltransferase [Pseudomonas putida]PLV20245.1 glycosyl transferase family 2 [Pseudomonas guariconensis]PLV25823.1 glycosyl transferase family 2 [Pseudomonas guariconensis]PLV30920.1 glycosyl transferase family 2 [Pseudomonas guariconensis]CAB5530585.1 N-glycosyltransferase [Pseudomonas putida]
MNDQPLVSIVIPAFNPEFFRSTLISAVTQDYPHLEIVVCDESPGTQIETTCQEVSTSFPVSLRYVRNPRRLGFARNLLACLEQACGDLIKFLCDDDVLFGSHVRHQAKVMNDWPQVSMVISQRLLYSADDILLPSRSLNFVISPESAVLNGGDLLASIADNAPNLFGGISHALFRRAQVSECLATLVQEGQGFAARLDLALYACLLRRGHLCSLEQVLSLERVHPGRLSHHSSMVEAYKLETEWLLQMLAARAVEDGLTPGWVRYLPLASYDGDQERVWEELDLRRAFAKQMANFSQQIGTHSLSFAELYSEWLECRRLSAGQLRLLPKRIEQWPGKPRIVPVIFAEQGDATALHATLDSLNKQSYAAHRALVLGPPGLEDAAAVEAEFRIRQGDGFEQLNPWLASDDQVEWIYLLRAGDVLHEHALAIMAERMALRADCACLYSDEGAYDGLVSSNPIFKPDFNLDLMRSVPYVGRLLAFKSATALALGGFDTDFGSLAPHDLLWRLVETHGLHVVEHIPEVLVQCQYAYAQWLSDPTNHSQAPRILRAHLQRLGVSAQVDSGQGGLVSRVTYAHDSAAMVSILVHARADLPALTRCVESLFGHTNHGHFELLLIASGDEAPEVRSWLSAMRDIGSDQLRVVETSAQGRAASLNEASLQARGDYVLLLNANCVLFDGQWLHELMHHAQRPEVGVVGPMILAGDGAVVSAGLVLGMGESAGSPFVGGAAGADSYMNRLRLVQNWSALSLDCLLVRRELFSALDGLDAAAFNESLFDADFCLRAGKLGYLAVWTPFSKVAKLSVAQETMGTAQGREADRETFYQRWLPWMAFDPAYNRNLSLKLANFNFEPGLRAGWDPFVARVMPSVLALPTNTTAVGHYRVAQPFTELERAGWIQGRINYNSLGLIELEREKPDVVILQCRYSSGNLKEMAQFKRFSSARRIYELDDYIIEPSKKNDHARNMPSNMRELVAKGISLCDRVVVSTEPLADALSSMHHDIRVVPNMLAASLWAGLASERQTSVRPRVGWAGGTSHRGDLELLLDVVRTLANEVDWVFFGMCPDFLRPYVKEFHQGISFADYPRKLASLNLDLALAPLEQNLFNDCKSNLRLLEYGACGFPVICTDTKAYAGYLPCTRVQENTTEQWLDAIRMHLSDPQASYRQGDALREVVLRDYVLTSHHLQHWANAWLAD